MTSTRKTTTTAAQGGGFGIAFNDHFFLQDPNTAVITRIVITYDEKLRSITVHYGDTVAFARGGVGRNQIELALPKGEFVTTVEGTFSADIVSKIAFETNKGKKWGPFGTVHQATTFLWRGFGPDMGLLYFSGEANLHIYKLQATFAEYPTQNERPAAVNYEGHSDTGPKTLPPTRYSQFAKDLMSPTITLLIGPDATAVFHAPQDILCRLPFFRAALLGEFSESSTHSIAMPEDDPQSVAALIEFLYAGRYTYPFCTSREDIEEDGGPAADIEEGLFHVGVGVTAHKYGCTELEEAVRKAFVFVLLQLEGVEVLQLLKAAYAQEMLLSVVQDEDGMEGFRSKLSGLMKGLFAEHATEMEMTVKDYPALVRDLFRMVVSIDD